MENKSGGDLFKDIHQYLSEKYLTENGGFVGYIIEAFNEFVANRLPLIFQKYPFETKEGTFYIKIVRYQAPTSKDVWFPNGEDELPSLYPQEAREALVTYDMGVMATVVRFPEDKKYKEEHNESKEFELFRLPVMLRSDYCYLSGKIKTTEEFREEREFSEQPDPELREMKKDPGGYFIIRGGKERVISFQDRLAFGQDLVYANKAGKIGNYLVVKYGEISNAVSVVGHPGKNGKAGKIFLVNYESAKSPINSKKRGINLFVAFAVLGYKHNNLRNLLIQMCPSDVDPGFIDTVYDHLKTTEMEASPFLINSNTLLNYLRANDREAHEKKGPEAQRIAKNNFFNDLFPQIPITNLPLKAKMLSYMFLRLMSVIIRKDYLPDNRDETANKQFQSPAVIIEKLIQQMWKNTRYEINKEIINKQTSNISLGRPEDIAVIIRQKTKITQDLNTNFINSGWGVDRNNQQNGVVEDLNRDAGLISVLGQLTRIRVSSDTAGAKASPSMAARDVQADQSSLICLYDTPDSSQVGLTKNTGWASRISQEGDSKSIQQCLEEHLTVTTFEPYELGDLTLMSERVIGGPHTGIFFLNAFPLGWCNPEELFLKLRSLRRQGKIWQEVFDEEGDLVKKPYFELGLGIKHGNLYVSTSSGRSNVPRIIIQQGPAKKIELLDGSIEIFGNHIGTIDGKSWEELLSTGVVEYMDALESHYPKNVIATSYEAFLNSQKLILELADRLENIDKNDPAAVTLQRQLIAAQEENSYSHILLDPSDILGISGSLIPFPGKVASARKPYACKMLQQGINRLSVNRTRRYGPKHRTLVYGNQPLFVTDNGKRVGMDEFVAGETLIVMFAAIPETEEDSVVWNQRSIDVGKFTSYVYETLEGEEDLTGKEVIVEIWKPIPKLGEDPTLYDHLDRDGIARIGDPVEDGQIVIAMIRYPKAKRGIYASFFKEREKLNDIEDEIEYYSGIDLNELTEDQTEDLKDDVRRRLKELEIPRLKDDNLNARIKKLIEKLKENYQTLLKRLQSFPDPDGKGAIEINLSESVKVKKGQHGTVDGVKILSKNDNRLVQVKLRQRRNPVEGDKQTPRYAQKATIGKIRDYRDMPFSETGIVPDVIVNPHAMPGRMTITWLIEVLTGKMDAIGGTRTNATGYRDFNEYVLMENLVQNGYTSNGKEIFTDGITGEIIEGALFIGPSWVQALRHQVADKITVRGPSGVYDLQSGTPIKGRKKVGGSALHFGTMDVDASIAHGASRFVTDRLRDAAVPYKAVFCDKCQTIVSYRLNPASYVCPTCKGDNFSQTLIPFSMKYISQQMAAGNMRVLVQLGDTRVDNRGITFEENVDSDEEEEEPEIDSDEEAEMDIGGEEEDEEDYDDAGDDDYAD